VDVLVRILGFEEQELGDDQVGHVVFDLADAEDDPLFQQPRIDIVGTLAACGLLDNDGHQTQIINGVLISSIERITGHALVALGRELVFRGPFPWSGYSHRRKQPRSKLRPET
jgi:hypothetical protein